MEHGQKPVFSFSYLYIDNFRTMKGASLAFDHRFTYDAGTNSIRADEDLRSGLGGAYFYGKNISSMSVVVGKNGTGKSSLIDFLRETFVLLLHDYADRHSPEEELKARPIRRDLAQRYHIEPETDFLVIFRLHGRDFYITNMQLSLDRVPKGLVPWNAEYAALIEPDWRYAYFSMTRERTRVQSEEYVMGREGYVNEMRKLLDEYQIDLSEETINGTREMLYPTLVNLDLLLQIVFMCEQEEYIREKLGESNEKPGGNLIDRMEIRSERIRDDEIYRLTECIDSLRRDKQFRDRGILGDLLAYIRPFSSGQYSRFVFMSRMYWCFEGMRKFSEDAMYGSLRLFFDANDAAANPLYRTDWNEQPSVLLFDEGDLFYHPEWQRRYVCDIVEMVEKFCPDEVQIIFTTNSPFMLSDLLRSDVHVLADRDASYAAGLGYGTRTFGQNIHMLLANPFFMEKTIGALADERLNELFAVLKDPEKAAGGELRELVYARYGAYLAHRGIGRDDIAEINGFVRELIESVGEDLYRKQLLYYFDQYEGLLRGRAIAEKAGLREELQDAARDLRALGETLPEGVDAAGMERVLGRLNKMIAQLHEDSLLRAEAETDDQN